MTSSSGRMAFSVFTLVFLLGALVFSGCSDSDTGTAPAEDTTDPTVHLAATDSILVSEGINTYAADAYDDEGVALVNFYDGSTLLGDDEEAPFTLTVSYTESDNGVHEIWASAVDAAGNSGDSDTLDIIIAINVVAEFINPGFTTDADGWTLFHLTEPNGWTDEVGNPPGCMRLNEYGGREIDPGIQQDVSGFIPGVTYEVSGEYRPYVTWIGNQSAESFVVTVDSLLVGSFARGPNGAEWSPFTAEFTATGYSHVIGFWAEYNGDDSSYELDNVLLSIKALP